jgi:AcrR family transcriptional regulator
MAYGNTNPTERILTAAEKLFAEKGFSGTSIREITTKAHCNLVAVNYYFHGKDRLYIEVFNRRMNLLTKQRIGRLEQQISAKESNLELESLIRSFAEMFWETFIKDGSGQNFMKLLMHEMYNPHLPKELFLNKVIQPLRNIVRQALLVMCPRLDRIEADLCFHSIAAQLLNALQAQDLFKGLSEEDIPFLNLEKVLNHIVRFSAAGIWAYAENKKTNN